MPLVAGLRAVAPEALHVTLAFLGWRPLADAEAAGDVLAARAAPVGVLGWGGALWLPRRRPRVLAVALEDPAGALGRVQAAVEAGLAEALAHAPESRPFLPHVTVARVPRGARAGGDPPAGPPARRFAVGSLTLYRSHPVAGGARYEPLRRVTV